MAGELNLSKADKKVLEKLGYTLKTKLGEGSYGKVYLATYSPPVDEQESSDINIRPPEVACKVIDTSKAPKDFSFNFFPRELDLLMKLSHPHLIHVHGIFHLKNKFFIFMRFAELGDMLDHVLTRGEVPEDQARVWLHQLGLGIQYLHTIDVVHRDIKCENVLITSNYNVKLADFGFARFIVDAGGKQLLSDTHCGSIAYASPEILSGKPYNPKYSDVWSLGVVLYVMLNRSMPFNDAEVKKLYEHQVTSNWRFRSKVVNILSQNVKTLVGRMLDPNCDSRILVSDLLLADWFKMDVRLLELTESEKEALEIGKRTKAEMRPTKKVTLNAITKECITQDKNIPPALIGQHRNYEPSRHIALPKTVEEDDKKEEEEERNISPQEETIVANEGLPTREEGSIEKATVLLQDGQVRKKFSSLQTKVMFADTERSRENPRMPERNESKMSISGTKEINLNKSSACYKTQADIDSKTTEHAIVKISNSIHMTDHSSHNNQDK